MSQNGRSRFAARPPAIATVLTDDECVRVTRWDFEPGAETGWHIHGFAYVVVVLTDAIFLLETKNGEQRVEMKAGTTYRRDRGVEHNVVNGGTAPMAFVEVEIKR